MPLENLVRFGMRDSGRLGCRGLANRELVLIGLLFASPCVPWFCMKGGNVLQVDGQGQGKGNLEEKS